MSILANDTRRMILELLRDGERSAGDLAELLERPRPGISHHVSILLQQGLVRCRVAGAFRYYSLDDANVLAAWDAYVEGTFRNKERVA